MLPVYDNFLLKIFRFFKTSSIICQLSLPFSAINSKMTFTGGNHWPFYIPTNPFGTFAAFSASWHSRFKSNFTLKKEDFSSFFSSFLGSKKLRFGHTTILASECMWKAHLWPRKTRPITFKYKQVTLTYGIFHVNRNTFP